VWKVLATVRKEFEKFEDVLKRAQDRIKKAGDEIENLVGTRTRVINRSLRGVEVLPSTESLSLPEGLDIDPDELEDTVTEE
jgi:DNA recombination protein RmuC